MLFFSDNDTTERDWVDKRIRTNLRMMLKRNTVDEEEDEDEEEEIVTVPFISDIR